MGFQDVALLLYGAVLQHVTKYFGRGLDRDKDFGRG